MGVFQGHQHRTAWYLRFSVLYMHPNTLNEMQCNLIEIRYRPEMKIHMFTCMLHCNNHSAYIMNLLQGYLIEKAVARFRSWSPLRLPMTETYIPFLQKKKVMTMIPPQESVAICRFPSRKGKTLRCFNNNNIKPIAYTYWIAAVSEESEASFTLWTETETKVTKCKEIYHELANGRYNQHDRPWHWTTYAMFF